ncbi:hypothetical protein [Phenylobacterium sp.]|uniref:hypothetical protein n=1 Tax=Phenylobacterium sp. TaxID=1871053 RepID=UPI0035B30425
MREADRVLLRQLTVRADSLGALRDKLQALEVVLATSGETTADSGLVAEIRRSDVCALIVRELRRDLDQLSCMEPPPAA